MIELALALVLAGDTPIERCRTESANLNTTRTIALCTAAGDDNAQPVVDRVDAYKLLGMALMVEGAADLAEDAFKKMLTLNPQATLGADAGPNAQKVLARAHASITPPPPPPPHEVHEVNAKPPEPPPAASPLPPGAPWAIAGGGGALTVASGIFLSGAVYDLYFNRVPCGAGKSCAPNDPLLFGIYGAGAGRSQFFDDAPAWIAAGAVGAAVGLGIVGAGIALGLEAPAGAP